MIGWIILAVAFFLLALASWIWTGVQTHNYDRAIYEINQRITGERNEARAQRDKLNRENADLHEAMRAARDERATLKLQLAEATKPKPRRGGTKKTEVQS